MKKFISLVLFIPSVSFAVMEETIVIKPGIKTYLNITAKNFGFQKTITIVGNENQIADISNPITIVKNGKTISIDKTVTNKDNRQYWKVEIIFDEIEVQNSKIIVPPPKNVSDGKTFIVFPKDF